MNLADPILVTGATGFLGGVLMKRLKGLNLSVIGQGRNVERVAAMKALGFDMVPWDMTNPADFNALPPRLSAVIHCAALSAPFGPRQTFERVNVDGTRAVLAVAKATHAARFVHISSPSIYFSLQDQLNVREGFLPARPFNDYARTKLLAENLVVNEPDLRPLILRPRGIYGAGDTALLPRLLAAARRGPLPMLTNGAARIDLTHVDDVVDGILAALQAPDDLKCEAFNISGGEVIPVKDIVEKTCAHLSVKVRWRHVPLRPALLAAKTIEWAHRCLPGQPEPRITQYALGLFAFAQSLDLTKAKEVLNWEPKISFDKGLKRTLEDIKT